MRTKNPTAFPLKHADDKFNPGMTLRDYFAGQALAGMVSREDIAKYHVGELCYAFAEELLTERQKYEFKNNG